MSDLDPIWTKLQVIGGAGPFGHVLVVVRTPHKAPDAVVWCLKVADIVREAGSTKKKKTYLLSNLLDANFVAFRPKIRPIGAWQGLRQS